MVEIKTNHRSEINLTTQPFNHNKESITCFVYGRLMKKQISKFLFIRILLIIIVILIGTPHLLLASEPFEFVSCFFESLGICKNASERLKDKKEEDIVSVMKDLIVFTNEVRSAKDTIAPYKNNKNKIINESATFLDSTYSMIVANNEKLLTLLEETLNKPSEAISKQGTWLRKFSENMAANEELWRMIPHITAMVSYALVDDKRIEGGKLQFLTITKGERDKLRSNLLNSFGESIKKGPKAGMLPIDASASLMWQFLSKDWKPADSK